MNKKLNILITGSSGQIGTNLALKLQAEGHCVSGIDKRPNTWTEDIEYVLQNLSDDYDVVEKAINSTNAGKNIDIVIHLAAHAKVHELVQKPRLSLDNVHMTFNVLEYCRIHDIPIVYSSSREVYGDIHRYITDEDNADFNFTESPYSASKISGEAFIYSYAKCYKMRYIVFRFSNVYGRFDNDLERMERVIPLFIDRIKNKLPITIYGAEKVLDFTYVDDCVKGIIKGIHYLLNPDNESQTINLAFGEGNSLISMAEYIGEALGIEPDIHIKPTRIGEVTRYIANIEKARKLLAYEPTTSLKEGIFKTVEWAEAHKKAKPKTIS